MVQKRDKAGSRNSLSFTQPCLLFNLNLFCQKGRGISASRKARQGRKGESENYNMQIRSRVEALFYEQRGALRSGIHLGSN